MNAQVNVSQLPMSIRRDGGQSTASLPRRPPQMGIRLRRIDAARLTRVVKSWEGTGTLDANETGLFLRQLLYIMPQAYEYKYPAIRYADLFPVNYSIPTGARSHAFHQYDEMGNAEITDSYADDAPGVDRLGIEIIGGIFGIRSSYFYDIQDLRSFQFAGIPLDAMKAVTARRIIERKCDTLAAVGDTKHGFTGILNDANISSVTVGTKAAGNANRWGTLTGSTVTVTATPDEILGDCTSLLNGVFIPSVGTHTPNTLVFGTQNWAIINTKRLDGFNMKTIADYLMSALPWVQALEYWPQLDKAGSGAKERLFACERSRENFEIMIPQEFEQFPPEWRNLAATIQCHKRFAGIQMRFPKSCAFMDGTV